jgi:hypothetical protein
VCEKLGASHLLFHGIFAFKITGAGARTDLVFGEPIEAGDAERTADTLVLTEWKIVPSVAKASDVATAARKQAELYQSGVLGGVELHDYRYIVLVSETRLPSIADLLVGGVTYRHVNIAVKPEVPSKAKA